MTQGSMCSQKQDKVTNPLKRGARHRHTRYLHFLNIYIKQERNTFIHSSVHSSKWLLDPKPPTGLLPPSLSCFLSFNKMFNTQTTAVNLIQLNFLSEFSCSRRSCSNFRILTKFVKGPNGTMPIIPQDHRWRQVREQTRDVTFSYHGTARCRYEIRLWRSPTLTVNILDNINAV